jgi:anti-anti-sigma regulatory factor
MPLLPMLDLSAAFTLADTLRATAGPVLLDGAKVERIGVSCIQLILSAQATAQAAGHAFGIEHPSDALRAALDTTGAGSLLSCDR